jgi:hypothetical protein
MVIADAPTEPEITTETDLCDAAGRLNKNAVGWSRHPLHRCNLRGNPMRKKRWNYWAVANDRYLLSATIADIDYLGLGSVYFVDFEKKQMIDHTVVRPFARLPMPETVAGKLRFRDKRLKLKLDDDGASVEMRAKAPSFGGRPMTMRIDVSRRPAHETLNVVIPWSTDRFQFTSKQNTLPESGVVRIGDEEYVFEHGKSFAVLDYGRGVWKYETFWNWGAGSGTTDDGRGLGINLGGKWTDGTGMNENGFCLDGRLHKIHEDLTWDYDQSDFMKPWTVRSVGSDRVDLRLEPFFERVTKTNLLLVKSEVHQVFGRFSGTLRTDDGETVQVGDLIGWVEQQDARW